MADIVYSAGLLNSLTFSVILQLFIVTLVLSSHILFIGQISLSILSTYFALIVIFSKRTLEFFQNVLQAFLMHHQTYHHKSMSY